MAAKSTTAAAKAAAAKAAAKKKAAAAKEAAYIKSLSNPITSQYDPRIAQNAGFNPEMAATRMTSEGAPPVKEVVPESTKFPKAGKILRYKPGSKPGFRIPVFSDGNGGEFDGEEVGNPIIPGSTGLENGGTVTLAKNTFANTLALLMGEGEAGQPWVEELRTLSQGFINTGSTVEEAANLALREAKAKGVASPFVQRFSAIFKLQDRLNAGETVYVPTIAEYVKSEQQLGDSLRAVGLGELATRDVAAKIFGDANKSVAEATALITNVFGAIDNAPKALKDDLQTYFPGVDRTSIAKAILLGKEGAQELTKKVKSIEQLSAAKSQGVNIDLATGADLAAMGYDYSSSLTNFGTVKNLERGQMLGKANAIDFTQQEAISATFAQDVAAQNKIRQINETENAKFQGRAGTGGSQSLASRNRAATIL